TTAITVAFPATDLLASTTVDNEILGVTGGVIAKLPGSWSAALDYAWSRNTNSLIRTSPVVGDPDGAGPGVSVDTALANGTLNVLRDLSAFPLTWSPYLLTSPNVRDGSPDTYLNDITLRLSGPLLQLPGGPLTLSGIGEYRNERAADF